MKALGFSFDLSRCSGCLACVVACMDQNDICDTGPSFRQVVPIEHGNEPMIRLSAVSLACFHCSDAPCLDVCPKNAIYRDSQWGVVDVHADLCIGCRSCAMVCPFGAPRFYDGGKMTKCNLCIGRVSQDLEPACVHTCPTKALGFGSMEDLMKIKAEKASLKILGSEISNTDV